MKSLRRLIEDGEYIDIKGDRDVVIKELTNDSRNVKKGSVFFAVPGDRFDGFDYISKAIDSGASVIVSERWPDDMIDHVVWIKCSNVREVYAMMSSRYYDEPTEDLKVVGITGTNGKTTVASLLYNLFKGLGYKVGLVSTIEILIDGKRVDTRLTTPDALVLQKVFRDMLNAGCDYAFMEVSSHAVVQQRVSGVRFLAGVFTNISHDHLDYHGSFKEYIKAKKGFFDNLPTAAVAIVNSDDKNGRVMVQNTKANIKEYSLQELVDYKGKILSADSVGMYLDFNQVKFMTRLVGAFNAYNLLAVYAVAMELDVADEHSIVEALSVLRPIKGRLEIVSMTPKVVVDFAHTPDALENVLKTLQDVKEKGKLLTLVGCGGDRDKAKRPLMARLASHYSDQVVFTSDNPRSEDPNDIIKDMMSGLDGKEQRNALSIVDREMAIKTILRLAQDTDVVLIAGKGHEEYQEINGKREYFSDQQIVKDILSEDI